MSQQTGILDMTFESNADFSEKQYYLVKMVAANQVGLAAATTDVILGVIQNKPGSGTPLATVVRVEGTSKVVAGTPFSRGAMLTSDTLGRAITAETDKNWVFAIALEAAAATGDIVEVLISRFKASI